MTATSQTRESPREKIKSELAALVPSYQKLLPSGYSPDRLVTGALVALARNPELAKCTPSSIALALAQVAQWGLDLGMTAHLVPFGSVCTAVADYKGYIELMIAAGARKVEAHEVRQGDEFDFGYGTEPYLRHKPRHGTAPILGAYAIVWLRADVTQFEYMPVAEIEAIRGKSKQWAKGELTSWYARKCVIRRLTKYVAKTPRLAAMLRGDETELAEGEVSDPALAGLAAARRVIPALRAGGYDEPSPPTAAETGDAAEPEEDA
jgi:recombination protein RecT